MLGFFCVLLLKGGGKMFERVNRLLVKEKIGLGIVSFFLLLGVSFMGYKLVHHLDNGSISVDVTKETLWQDDGKSTKDSNEESEPTETEHPTTLYADIKGAVQHPGIYKIEDNMRVNDLVELAGGILKEADDKQVNFAKIVTDQAVIYIPKKGEEIPITLSENQENKKGEDEGEASGGKVNINTATKEILQTVSGIGEKKAEAILTFREENGSFKTVDDLKNVSGIGEKTVEKLKEELTV